MKTCNNTIVSVIWSIVIGGLMLRLLLSVECAGDWTDKLGMVGHIFVQFINYN